MGKTLRDCRTDSGRANVFRHLLARLLSRSVPEVFNAVLDVFAIVITKLGYLVKCRDMVATMATPCDDDTTNFRPRMEI